MASKQKRMTVNSGTQPNSDINMTPMVDIVLVLLIIFMVVTPLLEKDIDVAIPDTEQPEEIMDVPPDQLVVGITAEGQLAINLEKVSDEEYLTKLKRMVAAKPADQKLVFFMPDEKVNYGRLVAALDGARLAGAKTLGMMTEIPEGGLQQAAPADPNAPPPPPPGG
ncbi:MAG: biopolymer transporter ExbD [Myxococcota bacterium]|nr:biopolymer transporter ExbD [Myxococcota bacterium]